MQLTLFGNTDGGGLPGGWTKETFVVGFGDVDLDLRERPPAADASLTVFRLFGDVRITVPPETRVQLGGVTVFGDRRTSVDASDGPLLRLKVLGVAGDVNVEGSA